MLSTSVLIVARLSQPRIAPRSHKSRCATSVIVADRSAGRSATSRTALRKVAGTLRVPQRPRKRMRFSSQESGRHRDSACYLNSSTSAPRNHTTTQSSISLRRNHSPPLSLGCPNRGSSHDPADPAPRHPSSSPTAPPVAAQQPATLNSHPLRQHSPPSYVPNDPPTIQTLSTFSSLPRPQSIKRTDDFHIIPNQHVRIDHRRLQVTVPE